MATPRSYQQFCPVGAALNAIGDRWALLIVRDLMLGPRRYSELLHGLGGIGTDILATRLRSLEEHGIVRRIGTGRTRKYELTPSGRELRPVLVALGSWGASRLERPDDPSQVPPRVPLSALLLGASNLPANTDGAYEFRVESETVTVEVTDGQIEPAIGTEGTKTIINLTMVGLRALVLGLPISDIEKSRDLLIDGNDRKAKLFLEALAAPQLLERFLTKRASN